MENLKYMDGIIRLYSVFLGHFLILANTIWGF